MIDYRKLRARGESWFFTVALAGRDDDGLLLERFGVLREAFRLVKASRPFRLDAAVVLPDHLHCVWTLAADDVDYATRWQSIKRVFSRGVERRSPGWKRRGERELWRPGVRAQLIVDDTDFRARVDYIHRDPVKHGHVARAIDWEHSSFRHFMERGVYPPDWGSDGGIAPGPARGGEP